MIIKARVTSKGQVTLPKALRETLGIHEGDHVEFALDAPGNARLRKLPALGSSAGALKHLAKEQAPTVEEMDALIREKFRKKHARLRNGKEPRKG